MNAIVHPFQIMESVGVVPVIAIDAVDDAIPLADALLEGGLPIAEITFRTRAAAAVLGRLKEARPELTIGAGTVLDRESLSVARQSGAQFGLSPGFDAAVVAAAADAGIPFAPGIMTPSDLTAAVNANVRVVKFFPAATAGGPAALEAVAAPFAHLGIRFIPTGGISEQSISDWLRLRSVLAVGGTWIARSSDIREGRWTEIARRARSAREAVASARDAQRR